MSQPSVATSGHVVSIAYRCLGTDGTLHDSSEASDPLVYLHGAHNIVPGLEEALEGKAVGESIEVLVPAAKAYGQRMRTKPLTIRRSELPDTAPKPFRGMQLSMRTQEGRPLPVWVSKIQGSTIYVDPNHPLAAVRRDRLPPPR